MDEKVIEKHLKVIAKRLGVPVAEHKLRGDEGVLVVITSDYRKFKFRIEDLGKGEYVDVAGDSPVPLVEAETLNL